MCVHAQPTLNVSVCVCVLFSSHVSAKCAFAPYMYVHIHMRAAEQYMLLHYGRSVNGQNMHFD